MKSGIFYIQKEKFKYELYEEGIRIRNRDEDKLISYSELFSIRYINPWKWEMILNIIVSILAFSFWWVLGIVLSLYTFGQYWASKRAILLTNKGQITIQFDAINDKKQFISGLKKLYPEAFKIKKWFQFRKES